MSKFLLYLFVLLSTGFQTTIFAKDCSEDITCNNQKISSTLSKNLITAMTYDTKTEQRVGNASKAIQSYINSGFLAKDPNIRADYVDYWVINNPVDFMGHDLLLIEHEYMSQHIGCCVNPGIGISVKVKDNLNEIKTFSTKNKCSFSIYDLTEFNNSLYVFSEADKVGKQKAVYATVSCRHRDTLELLSD